MTRLVLVLGDQLSSYLSALRQADKKTDIVVMAEVLVEAEYVPHHPKKIALILTAMRKFALRLEADGWTVAYTKLEDPSNSGSIGGELLRRAQEMEATEVLVTSPGEWRLIQALRELPLMLRFLADDRFVASREDFEAWAIGRLQLRMEYFYRDMRRKTGLMMEGDKPAGGKWNFDADNRKTLPKGVQPPEPLRFEPDSITNEVLDLVERRFGKNFGTLRPFWFATDQAQAEAAFEHFITHALSSFGDFQDAMVIEERFLFHAVMSPYLNIGLLDPLSVCRRVEDAWEAGDVPINAAEGFIRQVIGWREFVRGIYFLQGPEYITRNDLKHDLPLPALYWGGETRMNCLSQAIEQTKDEAYAHHIQRLMVTGNFALLAGVDPAQVHEWYLAVYADAFEWVEAPNTIGMSQFADGGVVGSKPYVSSGAYINRMSNYCKTCAFSVATKTGQDACPFNLLYWHFLERHKSRFETNQRMGNMYRTWRKMDPDKRAQILADAEVFLARLSAGEIV